MFEREKDDPEEKIPEYIADSFGTDVTPALRAIIRELREIRELLKQINYRHP